MMAMSSCSGLKTAAKPGETSSFIGTDKEIDEREGCGIQLKDGTIVMGIFYNGLYNADGSYGLKNPKVPGKHYLGAYIITSDDNGYTWSKPCFINTTDMPFENIEGPTDAPIEMPDGSIIMAVIGYQLDGDKNIGSVLLRSTDKGKTWEYFSTIAADPNGKMGSLVEPGIVRTSTGRIIAAIRTPASDNSIYTTYSDDDGRTWQPIKKSPMRGHPVDLLQLSDGRILATYGMRPPIHDKPGGIRACFSNDNGKTWDIKNEVIIRNDFMNWDIGYPESVQMPDGSILTVYYYNLFGKYFLAETCWTP